MLVLQIKSSMNVLIELRDKKASASVVSEKRSYANLCYHVVYSCCFKSLDGHFGWLACVRNHTSTLAPNLNRS